MQWTVSGVSAFAGSGGRRFDAARPVAVLVHGAGMDHSVWAFQARCLAAEGMAVLAVDLPGHGRSGGDPLPSIPAMGAWLLDFLDAAGVAKAAFAGHSMGAVAVLEAAAQAPERARAVAMLGAAARMPVNPDLLALSAAGDPRALDMVARYAHARDAALSRIRACRRIMARARAGVQHSDLAACDAYRGALDAVSALACPLHVICGGADVMTPAAKAEPLAKAAKDGYMRVLEGCGHMLMSERPQDSLRYLREVLA